jgi:hypothetical protein
MQQNLPIYIPLKAPRPIIFDKTLSCLYHLLHSLKLEPIKERGKAVAGGSKEKHCILRENMVVKFAFLMFLR